MLVLLLAGLLMADLTDDEVTRTLDYLGRSQPLAPERLGLATGTGGAAGGGGVTAAPTPSAGVRAQAARELANPGGPSGAAGVISNISTAKSFAEKLMKINELFPSETRRGETGGTSLSDAVRSNTAGGTASGAARGAIDSSRDFLGDAVGPTSFGDIDQTLLSQLGDFATPSVPAGFEAAEAAQSATSAGAAGAEAGAGAASSALPAAGPALGVLGGALSLAQDISSNAPDSRKAINAAVDAAVAIASIFFPPAALAGPVAKAELGAAATSAESGDIGGVIAHLNPADVPGAILLTGEGGNFFENQMNRLGFGQADIPHSVREIMDIQKHVGPEAQAFQAQLQRVKNPGDLWSTIVAWGSGTTGGNGPMAVIVDLPMASSDLAAAVAAGAVVLPDRFGGDVGKFLAAHPGDSVRVFAGEPNGSYPVFTREGFFNEVRRNPKGLRAGVQAGDAGFRLEKMNRALANTILHQAGALSTGPTAPIPAMPEQPVATSGPENKIVNPTGPSGALGFAQDVMDQPSVTL